ncbi:XRE family transcriptional regulator [Pseudoalteromonas luteoviolacea]|uniref:XRE family transcriptional regulator n=1 Tax=Pseudoalteromonas luteoviolacea TaxID=43657 RepID=A0A0C1QDA6_9GAMM|nr:helix-turn-helix transcriptional regulator [Pseudoalteromonas luteoviolacea]KID57390.1 XRE family transcriptional regulator [Pseudoalteromonas luteoviolacea]
MISGDDLKSMRVNAGLTQKEMADKLGISRETISNYELDVGQPKMRDFLKWLIVCKIDTRSVVNQIDAIQNQVDKSVKPEQNNKKKLK